MAEVRNFSQRGLARLAWIGLAVVVCGSPARAAVDDEARIVSTFEGYKQAVLSGEGSAAAEHLSARTLAYYGRVRELALTGSSDVVQAQPLADQLQILLYRTRVPMRMLETMSAQGLIAHSIEEGWIARDSVARIEATKADVRGDEAMLHVRAAGDDKGPAFFFRREAGQWRLDLVPVMRATEKPLLNAARREQMEIADFILAVVERAVDKELGIEAWIPLSEREESADNESTPNAPTGESG